MRRFLVLALLFCGAAYAYAGSSDSSGPVEFTFLQWNGGNWQNGYPYYIEPTNGPVGDIFAVMCDDYFHGGQPGDQWMANITDLGSGNISLARFNNLSGINALYPLMLYDESGWLLLQTQVEPTSEWLPINQAVWNIFDPSAPCNSTCEAWITAAINSIKGLPQSYFDSIYIVTPVNQHDPDPNGIQEFMYIGAASSGSGGDPAPQSTPEPGTFLLMGTGLLALFGRKLGRFLH
jgi:PEP-CTERM motif